MPEISSNAGGNFNTEGSIQIISLWRFFDVLVFVGASCTRYQEYQAVKHAGSWKYTDIENILNINVLK